MYQSSYTHLKEGRGESRHRGGESERGAGEGRWMEGKMDEGEAEGRGGGTDRINLREGKRERRQEGGKGVG